MPTLEEQLQQELESRARALSTFPLERPEDPGVIVSPEIPFDERIAAASRRRLLGEQEADVLAMTRQERSQFIAAQVGQEQLGPPGLREFGLRADIAFSNRFTERRRKFLNRYPEGSFQEVSEPPTVLPGGRTRPGGTTVLIRRNENEPFFELDAEPLDRFELLYDLADFSAEVPILAMELLVLRGGSVISTVVRGFLGGAIGEGAREAVEELRGFNDDTLMQVGTNMIVTGAITSIGAVGGQLLLEGPINSLRGATIIPLRAGVREAQEAAVRIGVRNLTLDQVSRSKVIQLIGRQSGALVDSIPAHIRGQQEDLVNALVRLGDDNAAALMRGEFTDLHDSAVSQILSGVRRSPVPLSRGGTAIQAGIAEYESLSSAIVSRAYATARRIQEPEFDIAPLLSVTDDVIRGVPTATRAGGRQRVGEPLNPTIENVIAQIRNLDPSLPTIDGFNATDQLRAIRSNLWSLTQNGPAPSPAERAVARQARQLFGSLTEVMRSPTNADDVFVRAWAAADREAAQRFDTLEKIIITHSARSETPAQLAARLARPNQVDNIRLLRDTIPANRFNDFSRAFKTDLLARENRTLTARLAEFDRETLDVLLTPNEQRAFRRAATQIDQLRTTELQAALAEQATSPEIAGRLFRNRRDTQNVRRLVLRLLEPGNETARTSARAGLMENIIDDVVTINDVGRQVVDAGRLNEIMRDLGRSGARRIFNDDDLLFLGDIETVARFVPMRADPGTALQAGEAAAGIRGLSAAAMITLLESVGTGRAFTSPTIIRALTGEGRRTADTRAFRWLGAAAAEINASLAEDAQSIEDQRGLLPAPELVQ